MNNDDNPLLPIVLQVLREHAMGISEYELLKRIEAEGDHFAQLAVESSLALFQKHFLIMNALYRLQHSLWLEEQVWLSISPLRIAIESMTDASARNLALPSDDALRTYYLDWQQFLATDSDAVAQLLASFWTRYRAHDGRSEALVVLELDASADWETIQQQYRRLAATSHPDRGGDAARFLAVRAAYEVLRDSKSHS